MARANENSGLRKASRPLSIIDENPDDIKGHAKTRSHVTLKSVSSPEEPSSKVISKTGQVMPSRRKAVAPLQHPVNLILPGNGAKKTQPTCKVESSNQNTFSDRINSLPKNQSDLPDVNGNGYPCQVSDNSSFHHLNNNPTDNQFSNIGNGNVDNVEEDSTPGKHCAKCDYNRTCDCDVSSNHELNLKTRISDRENLNDLELNSEHETLPHSRSINTSMDRGSSERDGSRSTFYLSSSSTSLDADEDVEESEKKDRCKLGNNSARHSGQIQQENRTKKTDVDAEQMEWKNRVKKSHSFIKIHNCHLGSMKRSLSATFNYSANPDINQNSINEHKLSSPGSLRRSRSQEADLLDSVHELHRAKTLLSLQRDGPEKSFSSSPQSNNNVFHVKNAPSININVAADDQSHTQPIRRISAIDQSDFSLLKVTANRLHLQTRRPSVMAWKEKYMKNSVPGYSSEKTEKIKMEWTDENVDKINTSLSMLRKELIDLRLQDQSLARQFLGLRKTMNSLRLTLQCKDHKELLDDAEEDIEELRELSQLVDLPPELFSPVSSLQNLGITRMNLSSRRFSTC